MTVKEFLNQYRNAEETIQCKLEEIYLLRCLATSTTQVLDADRVQSSSQNKTELIVSKIVDMEREVDEEVDKLQEVKREVLKVINSVANTRLKDLLCYRYICGYTFEKIAVAMDKSYMHICRLHGQALNEVKEILKML